MSTALRIIVISCELIGFLALCIFTIKKWHKEDLMEVNPKIDAKRKMKQYRVFFSILYVIIFAMFLFTFPTYVFLSFNKIAIVSIAIIVLSSGIIVTIVDSKHNKLSERKRNICIAAIIIIAVSIAMPIWFVVCCGESTISTNKEVNVQTIRPTMFEENKIAYTCDEEGKIEKYFYYYDDNGKWKYEEFTESEAEIVEIKDKNTYIERETTVTTYINPEKKPSSKDYSYEKNKVMYKLFINYDQAIEIETN